MQHSTDAPAADASSLLMPTAPGFACRESGRSCHVPALLRQTLKMTLVTLITLITLITLPGPAHADAQKTPLRLFRDYYLGMPRADVLSREGAYDCAEALGPGAVCMNRMTFLDQDWSMDFGFTDQGLLSVTLHAVFSPELYTRVFAALDERFELVSLQSEQEPLDLVALWRNAKDTGEASRRMSEYEAAGLARSNLAYVFLERVGVQDALEQAQDLKELLAGAHPDTRAAGMVLRRDDDGKDWLVLQFDAARPGPAMQKAP